MFMSAEFEDFYNSIADELSKVVPSKKYIRYLLRKNYFRIKTAFYEDENPEEVAKELKFQVMEHEINEKKLITEGSKTDSPVRQIVRDLVTIIKRNEPGYYYLPEELDESKLDYDFGPNFPYMGVEIDIKHDMTIKDDYLITGGKPDDEDVIELILYINPERYPQSLFDIVADLNDNVRHEMEHIFQTNFMRPEDQIPTGEEGPQDKEYYKQAHEIPAELAGFRRIVKLRKEPVEKVISDWFRRNQQVHQLSKSDMDELTDFLVAKYKEYYG